MQPDYAIAIVGAGPTGLTLANLLGAANIRTLLIEANASTVSEPRAVSIDDESLRVIQGLGLLDVVARELVSGYGSEYYGPAGHLFLRVKPLARPYGHPRRNAFRQPVLEDQLRTGLSRFSSVDTSFSCKVEGFEESREGVLLHIKDNEGATRGIHASYVLACDGARSQLREQLGFKLEGSSLDERWLIIDLENSPTASSETIVFCDPRRPCIALPGPHSTRRYEFKLLSDETDEEMLADARVAALLASHQAEPGSSIIRKTVYHFHALVANHWGSSRIWLAGDAAHLMPPFAGQGMNSGIRDAANIGWKVAEVVTGRIGPLLLQSYESERRVHVKSMIQLALRMGAIMGPRSALHGVAIRNFFNALRVWPKARSYFAEMKYKPSPQFEDGFLLPTSHARGAIVGRMLPQPVFTSADGSGVLMDELLGDGFVLIGVDIDAKIVAQTSLGAIWNDLLAKRVAISTTDFPDFAALRCRFILLRPDRYVMASFAAKDLSKTVAALEALWQRTWPAEKSQ
jgi:3-(3-hydroxy-phenyl)propionate hydroxylase